MFRTDRNNNPAALIVDLARQAGLIEGKDFVAGDPFNVGDHTYYTAKLLGDPVALTIRIIDAVGYYTKAGSPRWTYIALPDFVWKGLDTAEKQRIVAFHYQHEGGTALKGLFK